MEQRVLDDVIEKLRNDEDFQKAVKRYEEAENLSSKKAGDITLQLVKDMDLQNPQQTLEEARFNLIVAKMTAAKILASLSSFSYDEKTFMESLKMARECVQTELVPMLMDKEPCGECENCKNGKKNECLNPVVRTSHCESRFLPLLSDALIEYDAWSEILYNHIPQDKRDIDVLKDINDDFQNQTIKKRRGRPPKQTIKEEDK